MLEQHCCEPRRRHSRSTCLRFISLRISSVTLIENGSTGWTATGVITESRWVVRGLGAVRIDFASAIDYSDQSDHALRYNLGLTAASRLGPAAGVIILGRGNVIPYGDSTPGTPDGTNFNGIDVDGGLKTRVFVIRNTSNQPLTLAPGSNGFITLTGANADDFVVVRQPATTIAPGASTPFSVRFDPSALGFRYATGSFAAASSPNTPFHFDIRGAGVHLGRITVAGGGSPTIITNGAITPIFANGTRFEATSASGSASVTHTFIISNSGPGALVLNGTPRIAISGTNASAFQITMLPE